MPRAALFLTSPQILFGLLEALLEFGLKAGLEAGHGQLFLVPGGRFDGLEELLVDALFHGLQKKENARSKIITNW